MEANDDRVAVAVSGAVLRVSGAGLVLGEWHDPGGGTEPPTSNAPLHTRGRDDEAP
jgi:hypothetical protein